MSKNGNTGWPRLHSEEHETEAAAKKQPAVFTDFIDEDSNVDHDGWRKLIVSLSRDEQLAMRRTLIESVQEGIEQLHTMRNENPLLNIAIRATDQHYWTAEEARNLPQSFYTMMEKLAGLFADELKGPQEIITEDNAPAVLAFTSRAQEELRNKEPWATMAKFRRFVEDLTEEPGLRDATENLLATLRMIEIMNPLIRPEPDPTRGGGRPRHSLVG